MKKNTFDDIINFAIEREKEAVKFYQDLQVKIVFKNQLEFLKELENIEKSHIEKLKNIKTTKKDKFNSKKIEDMKISEYLIDIKPSEDMKFQDILILAMKREEKAKKLYEDLANNFQDKYLKEIFTNLANEETEHKMYFEKIYEKEILQEN